MITYDLWWGNIGLCQNFDDVSELLSHVADRMDWVEDIPDDIHWRFDSVISIRRAMAGKLQGVLLIGTSPRRQSSGYIVPARAYQIIWRDVREDTMKIGQRLKQLRNAYGLTLDDAAFVADISRTQLVAYEHDRPGNNPRLATLFRLAKAYNVTMEELFRGVTEA